LQRRDHSLQHSGANPMNQNRDRELFNQTCWGNAVAEQAFLTDEKF